jgi:GalNAc-alpha-(1->4)-GalNAc-alpha-(1->3)-diNAcBac-PP-undecaprenol alpha-1,4-N-acetyl-D-galactosaminyltransferase
MKHICIISPSLKIGGIQRALVGLANYYVEKGLKVSFITCFSVTPLYTLDERVELIDHKQKRGLGESGIEKISFYIFLLKYVRHKVRELKPDVVLSFGDIMGPFVLGSLMGLKVPKFIGDRTSADYKFKFPLPQLKKWLYPKSTGYFAQTTKAALYRKEEFGNKLRITVVPNGIRTVQRYNVPRENVILYVGRFAWEKAPERLIEAFSKVKRHGWTLEMAGDGPLLNKMKKLVKELSINDKVIFHGEVKNVDALFARASIYVIPSILEGFPNALCEAMAAGLPSICFETIPYEDIFTDGYDGFAVAAGDIDALGNKITELIDNPELRNEIGKNALGVIERLSMDRAAKTIYREMFGKDLV